MNNSRKATIALYSQSLFSLEVFLAPVMVLFYLKYVGLSFYEMSTFFSIILILNWILELPTGIISDIIGRKIALLIGKIIYLCGLLLLLVIHDWIGLIFIAFLFALGNTLGSGNLSAICFDLFSSDNNKQNYHKQLSISNSISLTVSAIAAIFGGYLADINFQIVIYLDALMLIFSIISVWLILPNDKIFINKSTNIEDLKRSSIIKNIASISTEGYKIVSKSQNLIFIILISALSFSVLRTGLNLYQPIMENKGIEIANFGWWFASFNIIAAISSYIGSHISDSYKERGIIFGISAFVILISTIIINLNFNYYVIILVAIAGHQIIRGMLSPYLNYRINLCVPDFHSSRTTVLSFSSLVTALLAAIVMMFAGFLEVMFSVEVIFSLISALLFIGVVFIYFILKRSVPSIESESKDGSHR